MASRPDGSHGLGQRPAVCRVGHVAGDRGDRSRDGQVLRGLREASGVAGVDHDVPPAEHQLGGEGAPEAAGSSGDQGNSGGSVRFPDVGFHGLIVRLKVDFTSRDGPQQHDLLSIGEVAQRTGMAASALRYYEREGLITAIRSAGGQRRYPRSVLRRLAFVRAARTVGLSLEEVHAALGTLPASRTPTKADWARLSQSWRARLDEQIVALTALRDGLTSCIGCGCLSLRQCALSNPGDMIAAAGPGARYLPASLRRPSPPDAPA